MAYVYKKRNILIVEHSNVYDREKGEVGTICHRRIHFVYISVSYFSIAEICTIISRS